MNFALFILLRQINAIHQLKKDFEKHQSDVERAFNLPAITPPTYTDLIHNFVELNFLLDSSKPEILMRLSTEQECFHQAIESLRIRNKFYLDEIQPAIANLGINGKDLTKKEMQNMLGERLYKSAINQAQIAWEHIKKTSDSIPKIHKELHNLAKEIFPKQKFINYEYEHTSSKISPSPNQHT